MATSIYRRLFDLNGWTVGPNLESPVDRCVIIAAPHTSNWDFIYAMAVIQRLELPNPRFTIKQEWMRFPFSGMLDRLGAIPIDRSRRGEDGERMSMANQMSELLKNAKKMTLIVTPEGTRSAVSAWKTGFYHIAKNANVPILVSYMDYAKKEAGIAMSISPTGDYEADMRRAWDFYNQITPKFVHKYTKM